MIYILQYKHNFKVCRKSQRLSKVVQKMFKYFRPRAQWLEIAVISGHQLLFCEKKHCISFCFLTEEAVVICLKAGSVQQNTDYLVYSFQHSTKQLVFLTSDVMLTSSTSKCTSTSHDTCLTKHKMVLLLFAGLSWSPGGLQAWKTGF